ncbi:MAG: U32 family peptidase C-terminal domain-containing protein [Candidatus Margulisbacteria bacterium]|nr:U32 family peptidase C-terminal domain-containing protein [Candidatus Margulisiibacteriota bacterium]
MHKTELLIPAGDLEKLQTAVRFGADAVYVGAGPYSLRTQQTAFDLEDLKQGVEFAHQYKVKVYLAMNIFPFDEDLPKMMEYLDQAVKLKVDAVIVSDPGLISLIRQKHPKLILHLSTQANTINSPAVKFWKDQGVQRIVLGRELSLAQVKAIRKEVPDIELELFVHGAMCMSYSGRCLLSKHMTGRSANRGECTQPCRWEYHLKEVTRPDEDFRIEQDARGTYVMNSKDLCMIEHIPEMVNLGIDSLKVEGRMKSSYYVALVTKIYRQAIDQDRYDPTWLEELKKVSHRNYTTGFYLDENDKENEELGSYTRSYTFVGIVAGHHNNKLEVLARNLFQVGDQLEIMDPMVKEIRKFKVVEIRNQAGLSQDKAHNDHHVFISAEFSGPISQHSLLRRRIPVKKLRPL